VEVADTNSEKKMYAGFYRMELSCVDEAIAVEGIFASLLRGLVHDLTVSR
jgi:hypothetical protein